MRRPLLLIAIFGLCANGLHARIGPASRPDEESSERRQANARPTRRVLFRTDSPRLFIQPGSRTEPVKPAESKPETPRPGKSKVIEPKTGPIKPAEVKPPTSSPVSFRIERPDLRSSTLATPTPETRKADLGLQPTTFTPYDPYMGTVRAVLSNVNRNEPTMINACELVREGRRFRYVITDPYRAQTPTVTESKKAGDCKAKALWLYDHLGDPSALYVIGKLTRGSKTSHAWVYWSYAGRWWILDPTDRATPVAADSVSANRYVPYYSYSRAGSFRHKATSLMLAMNAPAPAPAVAGRAREIEPPTPRRWMEGWSRSR